MLNKVPEKIMHRVRWGLAIGWLILILSMFWDPVTPNFTAPGSQTPFSLKPEIFLDPTRCVQVRGECVPEQTFSMSALIWWAMIVPSGIFILLVLGHEFWRRICPLSFMSQIPRALGIQRRRKIVDPISQEVRSEVVTIGENSWLGRNHLYVQFALFIAGLELRIIAVNGHRMALGLFLIATICCAILVGYLYAGKSWCQYFCPMAPVQMVYTGPRSLLGSKAHTSSKPIISQSMCRTVDPKTGSEQSACVACKKPCIDIDAEKTYWDELNKPGRRLVQYGYLGMVIAFYFYYFLYSGNWDYYFTGSWTHEETLLEDIFAPGFYINGITIPIPKAIAVLMTYLSFVAITTTLGFTLEKLYRRWGRQNGKPISAEQAQHVIFTIFTAVSFWTFFSYGARPSLNRMPEYPLLAFNALIVLVGAIWLYRTLGRTREQYERERLAASMRKQLRKLNPPTEALKGRSIEELSSDEVYTLVNALTAFSHHNRIVTYAGILQDLLEQRVIEPSNSEFCASLRQKLNLKDEDHFLALQEIQKVKPELLLPRMVTRFTSAATVARPVKRNEATQTSPRARFPDETEASRPIQKVSDTKANHRSV